MGKKVRYGLPDALRGFSMISMVAYHAMYDLVAIYGFDVPWYFDTPGHIWQQSICWCFIFISGMCWSFARSPLKKGIKISICGLIISLVTFIFMPSQMVIMGVLSFLGAAVIVMIPFAKAMAKKPRAWFFAMAALFALTKDINNGYLGFEGVRFCGLPEVVYQIPFGVILGFVPMGFYSSDYFSLMPWFFLFAAGHCFWQGMKEKESFCRVMQREIPLFSTLGKHSLAVYMLHQPVIMAVFMIVFTK
ncbi:MAG: DUF1624 domain-containing protein [Oscillospiraceae bacterium]|nr:DUF1624 domain-containing protein [Oscillospiraceae bacterium]